MRSASKKFWLTVKYGGRYMRSASKFFFLTNDKSEKRCNTQPMHSHRLENCKSRCTAIDSRGTNSYDQLSDYMD